MMKSEAEEFMKRCPILREYKPLGFRDFRDGLPRDYRAGLFYNEERGIYKVPCGSFGIAQIVARQIQIVLGFETVIKPPSDGTGMFWGVYFIAQPQAPDLPSSREDLPVYLL